MDTETLMQVMPCSPGKAALFAQPLTECMERFGIDTRQRQCMFLAQVAHESGSLSYVREIASGVAYENRKDLGNVQAGDGKRYAGRGLLQTTGRSNYRELQAKLQRAGYDDVPNFELEPEKLEWPVWAAASAGCFWQSRKLNGPADMSDLERVTRTINGGLNGLADRRKLWIRAVQVLCD